MGSCGDGILLGKANRRGGENMGLPGVTCRGSAEGGCTASERQSPAKGSKSSATTCACKPRKASSADEIRVRGCFCRYRRVGRNQCGRTAHAGGAHLEDFSQPRWQKSGRMNEGMQTPQRQGCYGPPLHAKEGGGRAMRRPCALDAGARKTPQS
jgi:hypothetical protein